MPATRGSGRRSPPKGISISIIIIIVLRCPPPSSGLRLGSIIFLVHVPGVRLRPPVRSGRSDRGDCRLKVSARLFPTRWGAPRPPCRHVVMIRARIPACRGPTRHLFHNQAQRAKPISFFLSLSPEEKNTHEANNEIRKRETRSGVCQLRGNTHPFVLGKCR